MSFARHSIVFLVAIVAFAATSRAVTLDWDGVTRTARSLSNSYDIDPAKAGNDIAVTVSGNTAQLQPELVSPCPQTPAITTDFAGGLSPVQNTFSTLGVQKVSFTLFDIDQASGGRSNYEDQLRAITTRSIDGTTLVAPTITTSVANTLTGTGLTQVVTGTASATDLGAITSNGNVTISFAATAIRSLTYGSGTVGDPMYQHVGLHDITFTLVPELNPAWSAVGSCLLAAVLILRHSAKFRK